ncbi:hypothetical protein [Salinibacter altiplanensis]|uniref:hypothetical protein n=1 Tax=Salinibacter altiplanensis TaxID=1803181 RepID=UPI000C9F7681|nr:hypothetical protein [Salinibacter altiplanensis]
MCSSSGAPLASFIDGLEAQVDDTASGSTGGVVFYDADDPAEPERSIEEDDRPGTAFYFPHETPIEELEAGSDCE